MIFNKTKIGVMGFVLGLIACGDGTSTIDNENANVCDGTIAMQGDDGVTYCVSDDGSILSIAGEIETEENTQNPGQSPSNTESTASSCRESNGSLVEINKLITGSDGSTYMFNNLCQKIILNEIDSENAGSSSSSQTSIAETITNETYESTSNGNAPVITYTSAGASIEKNNGCVYINGGEVVITCAGDYDFSGSYSGDDGQIRVYSPKADSGVYLNLRGLTLENTSDAPIYVQMASKTFVVAKSGTTNTLSDCQNRSKEFSYENSSGITKIDTTNATIYSKDDLTIKGEGSLIVKGNYKNGIQSSNDIRFRGETTVNVTAANNGIKGKGSVSIEEGNITINSIGDGIKSDEGEDENAIVEGKGVVLINGGTVNITASDDGIKAYNYIIIADSVSVPSITITAGSGTPDLSNSNGGGMGGGSNRPGGNNQWSSGTCYGPNCTTSSTANSNTEESSKGIVAGVNISIYAGNINVAAHKDAIHSNGIAYIKGGNLSLIGRNGIHADAEIAIAEKAVIDVPNSYEGFESTKITMLGGITSVYASDDGWNSSDGSGSDGCSSCLITVSDGFHYVRVPSGDTDGIDGNGKISITGGYVAVENMSSNGGTANVFDAGSGGSITGGNVLGMAPASEIQFNSYNVSFSANNYYGTSKWACKTHSSGSKIWSNNGQPSQVSNFSGMTAVDFIGTTASCYYSK